MGKNKMDSSGISPLLIKEIISGTPFSFPASLSISTISTDWAKIQQGPANVEVNLEDTADVCLR